MIISNKSFMMRGSLLAVGLGIFITGCTNPDDASAGTTADTAAKTTGETSGGAGATNASGIASVSFASIEPTLKARCVQCHSGPEAKEGYDFSSYETLMKGGKDGPAVKSGDPDNSLLVQVITGAEGHPKMPPMGDPLTEDQINAVKDWIKAGAPG